MIHIDLPYDYGTFVKATTDEGVKYGMVTAYTVYEDGYLIWVSGYRIPWGGEFLPSEVEPMKHEEIEELIKKHDNIQGTR